MAFLNPSKPTTYFITEVLPPNFRWDPIRPVRGTDRFYVRTAEEAVRLGRSVVVVYDGPETDQNGVHYINRSQHDPACPGADEVWLMNPRSGLDVAALRGAPVRLWTNFWFDRPDDYFNWLDDLEVVYDDLVVISSFARGKMPQQLTPRIVPHGVDHASWSPSDKDGPRQRAVAFTSSPDRGLTYLRNLWVERNIEATTGYRLVTSTYGDPNTTDRHLRRLLTTADFWIHPGFGNELFSLSAAEAQAAGCTPIVVPTGGLAQTVRHGYRFPREAFANGLMAVLSGEAVMPGVNASHIPSWRTATAALLGWDSLVI